MTGGLTVTAARVASERHLHLEPCGEYASSGTPAVLCGLRLKLQDRLGEMVEQVLRRPLAP